MIAFIGAGRMAKALIKGLDKTASPPLSPSDIAITARSNQSQQAFIQEFPHLANCWKPSATEIIPHATLILLCVKPHQIAPILPQLSHISPQTPILSVAAGITISSLQDGLPEKHPVIRAMPNTPLTVGKGATAFSCNPHVSAASRQQIHDLFSSSGICIEVPENQLDAVTALSGSGPAYFYLFTEYLKKAAIELGLPEKTAETLALATAQGAGEMLAKQKSSPEELIDQVKSKGGTTEAALNTFNQQKLDIVCEKALTAAYKRSKELAEKSS